MDDKTRTLYFSLFNEIGIISQLSRAMEVDSLGKIVFTSTGEDPLSARADLDFRIKLGRGPWSTILETRLRITADRTAFHVEGVHKAFEDDEEVFVRPVEISIPRES